MKDATVYWAGHGEGGIPSKAVILRGFTCWEQVQAVAKVGIVLPDGTAANMVGWAADMDDFRLRAKHSHVKVLEPRDWQDDAVAERYGAQLAEIFGLRRSVEHPDRWELGGGFNTQTSIGLTRAVMGLASKIMKGEDL